MDKEGRLWLQVFKPFVCELRPWDTADFLQCTGKRRMIMIGDMSMHQLFNSLACLLNRDIQEGSQSPWEVHSPPVDSSHLATRHAPVQIRGDKQWLTCNAPPNGSELEK